MNLVRSILVVGLLAPATAFAQLNDAIDALGGLAKRYISREAPPTYLDEYRRSLKESQAGDEGHSAYCPRLLEKFKTDGYKAPAGELERCMRIGDQIAEGRRVKSEWRAGLERQRLQREDEERLRRESQEARNKADAERREAERLAAAQSPKVDARSCAYQNNLYVGGWVVASRGSALDEISEAAAALREKGYTPEEQLLLMDAISYGMEDQGLGIPVDAGARAFVAACAKKPGMIASGN